MYEQQDDGLCQYSHLFLGGYHDDEIDLILSTSIRPEHMSVSEEFEQRMEGYRARFYEALKHLTPRQQKILKLHLEGYSQKHIGKILGCHQTTVHKTLFGNKIYPTNKTHGGILHKIKCLLLPQKCIVCGKEIMASTTVKYCSGTCTSKRKCAKCGRWCKYSSKKCMGCLTPREPK